MRVLYLINAGIMGGRERHVLTLVKSLPPDIEHCVCAVSGGEAVDAMRAAGIDVRVLGGSSGHDPRIALRFARLLREYRPDVVHAHSTALLPFAVMRFFPRIALVQSVHGPSVSGAEWAARRKSAWWKFKSFVSGLLQRRPDWFLAVSGSTWREFKEAFPWARGEVLFNALNLDALPQPERKPAGAPKVAGMVGRMADQKDWPSFARVASLLKKRMPALEIWGVGASEEWARENVAEDAKCVQWLGSRQDARELIAKMDVFIMTSKHEQLPTTMLEAFALHVPVAGFLPEGGTGEVLALAKDGHAALMNRERDCERAAADVVRILEDPALRDSLVREGDRIVHEYFDMKKLCAGRLAAAYREVADMKSAEAR